MKLTSKLDPIGWTNLCRAIASRAALAQASAPEKPLVLYAEMPGERKRQDMAEASRSIDHPDSIAFDYNLTKDEAEVIMLASSTHTHTR